MRGITLSVLAGCACAVAFTAQRSEAASTSPGKVAVYASTAAALVDNPTVILTETLQRGRKKRVLEVLATATMRPNPQNESGFMRMVPIVNGLKIMEPSVGGVTVDGSAACTTPYLPCQASAAFWLDLDAAEAANPGTFIGVPLVIELEAEWRGDGPDLFITVDASLQSRLEKK